MPDFTIKIIPGAVAGAPAQFVADIPGAKPGDPITLQAGDLYSWDNMTSEEHWPWPTDEKFQPLADDKVSFSLGNFLSERIAPGSSSGASIAPSIPGEIRYCCKLHPEMRGSIKIVSGIFGHVEPDTPWPKRKD
jgi:plastocyanin